MLKGFKQMAALAAMVLIHTAPAQAATDKVSGELLTKQVQTFIASAPTDSTSGSLAVRIHSLAEVSGLTCEVVQAALQRASGSPGSPGEDALRLARDLYKDCDHTGASGTLGAGSVALTAPPGFAVGAGTANYQ